MKLIMLFLNYTHQWNGLLSDMTPMKKDHRDNHYHSIATAESISVTKIPADKELEHNL